MAFEEIAIIWDSISPEVKTRALEMMLDGSSRQPLDETIHDIRALIRHIESARNWSEWRDRSSRTSACTRWANKVANHIEILSGISESPESAKDLAEWVEFAETSLARGLFASFRLFEGDMPELVDDRLLKLRKRVELPG